MGSTDAAGKVQIARSVAGALSCPLYQGDSLHESSAKAASVGVSRPLAGGFSTVESKEHATIAGDPAEHVRTSGSSVVPVAPNETRYQRMWLSKLTRTGLLFPEESRPANEGFSGFGGASSTSTSRRGSASSVASDSYSQASTASAGPNSAFTSAGTASMPSGPPVATKFSAGSRTLIDHTLFTLSEKQRLRRTNPALMVLTHPELESWHKRCIKSAVGEYGIGVVFVPLYDEPEHEGESAEHMPVIRPLDPRTMTTFPSLSSDFATDVEAPRHVDAGMGIRINVEASVEAKQVEIIEKVSELLGVQT